MQRRPAPAAEAHAGAHRGAGTLSVKYRVKRRITSLVRWAASSVRSNWDHPSPSFAAPRYHVPGKYAHDHTHHHSITASGSAFTQTDRGSTHTALRGTLVETAQRDTDRDAAEISDERLRPPPSQHADPDFHQNAPHQSHLPAPTTEAPPDSVVNSTRRTPSCSPGPQAELASLARAHVPRPTHRRRGRGPAQCWHVGSLVGSPSGSPRSWSP